MPKFEDLSKKKFERLTVLELDLERSNTKRKFWKCECKCGKIKSVFSCSLKNGDATSCGCYHKEMVRLSRWKGYKEISLDYWNSCKRGATQRNIIFNISIENAWEIYEKQNRKCFFSGLDIKFESRGKNKEKQTASLDRIYSNKNYVIDNICWVHKDINWLKNSFEPEKFIELCVLVANYQKVYP